jgi:glyoxylase I family protein
MSPVASAFASITGSCNCGTITVVTNRTRSVHADKAPSSVSESGLSNAIRSPQHIDENGPPSITRAHALSVAASRLGSITGRVIPIRTTGFWHAARGSMIGMAITANSVAHIRLTVTDIERSRQFYESVFGWPVALEVPPDADDATREQLSFLFGGVLYSLGDCLIGLRPVATDTFNENRVGLDHLCLRVASRAELDSAAAHLDELGHARGTIKDIGHGHILEFRDPDGIALELIAPK